MYLFFHPMLRILNADATVSGYFNEYYSIILIQLPVMVINSSFGMFIRADGNPQYFMKVNILNVILNIVLDYLFVRWFRFGVTGVAVASLIASVVMLLCILHFFRKRSMVYKLGKFHYSKDVLISTLFNGSSEFVGEMSMSISMFAFNYVILKYAGVDGVTAFTIVGYIAYLFSMILIGFGQGASPLISFCYGAKEYLLAAGLRKITNRMVFLAGVVFLLIVLFGSGWYSSIFVKNENVEQMVRTGMLIYGISFLFSGINTISSFYFTSIGKAVESAVISSARGLVILLILVFTLAALFGMTGVWVVTPATEILTLLISLFCIMKDNRRIIQL